MSMISLKKIQRLTLLCCYAVASQALSQTEVPPPPAAAPSAKVLLKVMVKGSGRILKRAEVRIGQEVLATGPDGTLELIIPDREGSIQVLRQGYEAVFIDFKDLRGRADYNVYLPPGKPDDSEVVITGQRRPETSRKTVTVQETSRIAPGGDPAQIAQLLPGVQSSPGSTEVVIRGSGPNDSRYFVDDIMVPSIFHQVANLSVVPAQQLTDVDFNSGGFGAQYGDATGGIVVLRSSDKVPEVPRTDFVVNVPFYLGIYHERPLSENSAIAVSFRKSTLEYILPSVIPDDADVTVVPLFGDAYVRYLTKNDTTSYKLTLIASEDGLTLSAPFDGSSEEDGKTDVSLRNRFAVIGWERDHNLGGGWRYRMTPQYSFSRFQIGFGDDKVHITNNVVQMPTEFTRRLDKGRNLYLGVLPQYNVGKFDVRAPAFAGDDPYYDPEDAPRITATSDFSFANFAAWSSIDLQAGSLIYTPGVRLFKAGFVDDVGVDPRLAMRYPLDESSTLKAATGLYSIAPEPQETNEEFGDPDISYEKSNHYVLGLETRWTDRWVTEFQAFYKKTYRLVVSGGPENYQDTGSRRTYGFEAFVRRNLTEQFFGWLAYTWSVSEERKSDQDDWYTSEYDQTHILNLAGSYKINAYWDLGTRVKYNTQSPYTPVSGAVYNSNLDKYQPIYDRTNPNSARAPASHSIALFATYDSLYDTFKLKYQFGVDYLAIGRRVDSVQYNYDYSEKDEISALPPIPYIQISGEF
jgi:hypothetical protein